MSQQLDDLTATRLCAEAMGYRTEIAGEYLLVWSDGAENRSWNPLHDDAQCMALVKKFGLLLEADCIPPTEWCVHYWVESSITWDKLTDPDLNRAIVYCVAKMQEAKR